MVWIIPQLSLTVTDMSKHIKYSSANFTAKEIGFEPGARMLLLAVVDLTHVAVERVLGAEDHLAVAAVQLLRAFMHLDGKT